MNTPIPLRACLLLSCLNAAWACDSDSTCDTPGDCPAAETSPDVDCGDACDQAFAAAGPHAVGFSAIKSGEGDDARVIKAWYPAQADGPAPEMSYSITLKLPGFPPDPVTVIGRAHADAPVAPAEHPYPLVVLSHGFSLNPEMYHPLAEHLASYGLFVMAPEHRESDWAMDVVAATVDRPRDISATIDFAASGPFAGSIDDSRVAVIGHSYGGFTSLAAAGARFDLAALGDRCATTENEAAAGFLCPPFLAGESQLVERLGLDAAPSGLWPDLGDPRVDAIVPIAGDAYLFGGEGLAQVEVPMMAIGGTADTGTPWTWGAKLSFDEVSSAYRVLVGFEGAEHFIPLTACENMPWTEVLPEEYRAYFCEDPAWSKDAGLERINHFVAAFLLDVLAEDPLGHEALHSHHYALEGGDMIYAIERP